MNLPDPKAVAAADWAHINGNHEYHPRRALDRVIIDSPGLKEEDLTSGLVDFHNERLQKIPSVATYPESAPWVENYLATVTELQDISELTDLDIAIKYSLSDYLKFRGYARIAPPTTERCRVAYLPDSDHGQIHIKNVDDPLDNFIPQGPITSWNGNPDAVVFDGVGSGMHFDDEPEEIFPLPVLHMVRHYADDLAGTLEFLERYKFFWGGCNQVVHDWKGNSVAIEKSSYNFMEVFQPDQYGRSHCSGMTCRDSESPQGKYQREKRLAYVNHFNMGEDCADMRFWATCRKFEAMLSEGLIDLGENAKADDVLKLFRGSWPDGLCKDGLKVHPDQGLIGYTLIIHAQYFDEKTHIVWQRDPKTGVMPEDPEVYCFQEELNIQ